MNCSMTPERYHALVDTMSVEELTGFLQQIKSGVDRTVASLPTHTDYLARFLGGNAGPRRMTG